MTNLEIKSYLIKLLLEQSAMMLVEYNVLYNRVWFHVKQSSSLQLTEYGFDCFTKILDLHSYSYKILDRLPQTSKVFLQLNNITSPFYIKDNQHIVLFGEQDAVMLVLTNFNLTNYIDK